MNQAHRRHAAFTLVEILIVVCILSILAAIVIPRFTASADEARRTAVYSTLTTARKQIQLWSLDHGGTYPTLAQMQDGASDWGVFTSKTLADGAIDPAGIYGPYFPSAPLNVLTNSSLVVAAGGPVATAGWTYNAATGALRVVLPATVDPASTDLTVNDYEVAP